MFGKLKQLAAMGMIAKALDQINPLLQAQVEKIKTFTSEQVFDDHFFDSSISKPAWEELAQKFGAFTSVYPGLETIFINAMRNLRDELVLSRSGEVVLADDYQNKFSQVLMENFKNFA